MASLSEKQRAAEAAVEHVQDGMLVGLGTGSTAAFAVKKLGEKVRAGLKVKAVPTSEATRELAEQEDIELTTLEQHPELDLCIDGADEVDHNLQLIKGGGGALLREKIVAAAAKKRIIIVDSSKKVADLGKFPLPVEIIPFGWEATVHKIQRLHCTPVLRLNGTTPFRSDEGNFIVDCAFGRIESPIELETQLNLIAGVVENGLFVNMTEILIIGHADNVTEERRP